MIVTTTELQNSFGKYLKFSETEDIIITKNGKRVAMLVPYKENISKNKSNEKGDRNEESKYSEENK
ncbi:MAG: type II toxin-antitoxin system Phd/YefM family antitoxin, partial [Firmicutes bacterium]|nr:type II toxin-antitoxin system Phd/YefM family antitoxin [Bacillota bacterium]NSW93035.1 type II toxin-antitoxin system Phd/YefM family antitoxin [Bacillota bacterium]